MLPLVLYSHVLFICLFISCCYVVVMMVSRCSGWLRTLCQQLMKLLMSTMQLSFVPLSLVFHAVPPALPLFSPLLLSLLIQASLLYTPCPSLFYSQIYPSDNLLCGNYLPFTHCALASCHTVCLCVCVCLWWLMAGHWPLPLLGKLCLCPRGLQICATPEPQLQLWAQAGAKSLLLLLTLTTSPPPSWTSALMGHFLPQVSGVVSVSVCVSYSPH